MHPAWEDGPAVIEDDCEDGPGGNEDNWLSGNGDGSVSSNESN